MKRLKVCLLLLLLLTQLFTAGCWNYRELDTLAIVAGFAVDKGSGAEGHKYHLTFELLHFSSGAGKSGMVEPKLLETDGNTIFEAVRNATKVSGKKLFFSHCKVVVISNTLAREGIAPLMDWINRDSEARETIDLIISQTDSARDILNQQPVTDQIVSYEIDKMLDNDTLHLSESPFVKLYEANDLLGEEGISLTLPSIDVVSSDEKILPTLSGTAVFKRDRLIGYLDPRETKVFLFIENEVKGGLWVVRQNSDQSNITLEIFQNKTAITPKVQNGTVSFQIAVRTGVDLGETEADSDYENKAGVLRLEATANQELSAAIAALIHKVQTQYDSDIFGFGRSVYQDHPEYWKTIQPHWDDIFSALNVTVSSNFDIVNTATAKQNVKAGK